MGIYIVCLPVSPITVRNRHHPEWNFNHSPVAKRSFFHQPCKNSPNGDYCCFSRESSVESDSEWCPAGIFEHFKCFPIASKIVAIVSRKTKTCIYLQV